LNGTANSQLASGDARIASGNSHLATRKPHPANHKPYPATCKFIDENEREDWRTASMGAAASVRFSD